MELVGNSRRAVIAALIVAPCALGACASGGGAGTASASLATLTVHIGLFGGPMQPGGGMALSDSPAQGEHVTVVDTSDRKHAAQTDSTGVATMQLSPGAYTVLSSCGNGPNNVVLSAGEVTHVQIDCPVP